MSKVRINDLAKELEVKSRAILDLLPELGVSGGKTHSSSLESDEADKVRAHFAQEARQAPHSGAAHARHAAEAVAPKIDLSHISKPGDVLKAVLAKKKEEEEEARHARLPIKPAAAPPAEPAAPAPRPAKAPFAAKPAAAASVRPEPRKIVPQPRSAPPIVAPPPTPLPAIASHPPAGAVVAKAPAGAAGVTRPVVVVAPPPVAVVVKPPAVPPEREEQLRAGEKLPAAKTPAAAPSAGVEQQAPSTIPDLAASAPHATEAAVAAGKASGAIPAIAAASTTAPAQPGPASAHPARAPRRMVMPQTGPRPVYTASIVPTTAPAAGAGIQRGKPIFDRRPAGGQAGMAQRMSRRRWGARSSRRGTAPQASHAHHAGRIRGLEAPRPRRTARIRRASWIRSTPGFGGRVPAPAAVHRRR